MSTPEHLLCPDSPSLLQIDLRALAENYLKIRGQVKSAETSAVVKADGYGLGAGPVVETLCHAGCRTFFVAHFSEALVLRKSFPDINIYVLNGVMTAGTEDFIEHNVIPVLNNLHDIRLWQEAAKHVGRELPAAIHLDTGMNRLGLGALETETLLKHKQDYLAGLLLKLIMSHFSSADEKDHPETPLQANKFQSLVQHFPGVCASLANSAGIFVSPDYHHDLVRPGMALYGLNPQPHTHNLMTPVISLQTKVLNIQTINKGEPVGYGAIYRASDTELLATVSLGYADGFFRSIGPQGKLFWRGHACPFRGRISMDLATVSLGGLGDNTPKVGDMLEVIGPHQPPEALAKDVAGGTIDYEIVTSLGQRYRKQYLN